MKMNRCERRFSPRRIEDSDGDGGDVRQQQQRKHRPRAPREGESERTEKRMCAPKSRSLQTFFFRSRNRFVRFDYFLCSFRVFSVCDISNKSSALPETRLDSHTFLFHFKPFIFVITNFYGSPRETRDGEGDDCLKVRNSKIIVDNGLVRGKGGAEIIVCLSVRLKQKCNNVNGETTTTTLKIQFFSTALKPAIGGRESSSRFFWQLENGIECALHSKTMCFFHQQLSPSASRWDIPAQSMKAKHLAGHEMNLNNK